MAKRGPTLTPYAVMPELIKLKKSVENNRPSIDILVGTGINDTALKIDFDGLNARAIDVNYAASGTAEACLIVNAGALQALRIDDTSAGGSAVRVEKNAANTCMLIIKSDAGAQDCVIIQSAGTANHIDTDAGAGTPAHLTNAGVWTDASCFSHLKKEIEPVDEEDILEKIPQVRISRYVAKADRRAEPVRTVGPFQEDLVGLFGTDPRGTRPMELAAVAIAAVKALTRKVNALEARLAT